MASALTVDAQDRIYHFVHIIYPKPKAVNGDVVTGCTPRWGQRKLPKPRQPTRMDDALDALRANPVAIWLENQVALEERDGELARRRPQRIGEIVEALAHDVGLAFDACRDFLADMLQWISLVNQRMQDGDQRYTVLPFKLHQFISQTGSVYAGLLELRRLPALNHARAAAEKAKIDRPSHSK